MIRFLKALIYLHMGYDILLIICTVAMYNLILATNSLCIRIYACIYILHIYLYHDLSSEFLAL